MLADRFGIPHISVGKILRNEVARNTPLGREVKPYVEKGDLAPTELVTQVIKKRLADPDCSRGFILDGYPRQMEDVEALNAICSDLGIKGVRVIGIEVNTETVIERVKNRRVCDNGHQYDLVQSPPRKENVCDIDGLPIYQRDDDTPETIRHRFEIYRDETVPVINYFKNTGNYTAINGNGSIEDVQKSLCALFDPSEEKKAA
jgi:adenylate kinase